MFWGWWGWSSGRGWRGGFGMFWGWLIMIGLVWLLSGGGMPGWIWWFILPMVIFRVLPAVLRSLNTSAEEKRKREEYTFDEEKPKREPLYRLGDDGELIEVTEDEADKPKRDADYL
jgi:hypothetical protein